MIRRTFRFLMGLLAFLMGGSIVVWVLYNYFVERQKEFTGGESFSGFGIGGVFVGVGFYWMRIAVRGDQERKTTDEIVNDHVPF